MYGWSGSRPLAPGTPSTHTEIPLGYPESWRSYSDACVGLVPLCTSSGHRVDAECQLKALDVFLGNNRVDLTWLLGPHPSNESQSQLFLTPDFPSEDVGQLSY